MYGDRKPLRIETRAPGGAGVVIGVLAAVVALVVIALIPLDVGLAVAIGALVAAFTWLGFLAAGLVTMMSRPRLAAVESDEHELRVAFDDLRGRRTVIFPRRGTRFLLLGRALAIENAGDALHLRGPEADDPAHPRLQALVEATRSPAEPSGWPEALGRKPSSVRHDRAVYTLLPVHDPVAPLLVGVGSAPVVAAGLLATWATGDLTWLFWTGLVVLLAGVALYQHLDRAIGLEVELSAHAVVARSRSRLRATAITVPISAIRTVSVTASRLAFGTDAGAVAVPVPVRSRRAREAVEAFLTAHVERLRPRVGGPADVPRELRRLAERE